MQILAGKQNVVIMGGTESSAPPIVIVRIVVHGASDLSVRTEFFHVAVILRETNVLKRSFFYFAE